MALLVYWWAPRQSRDVAGALAAAFRPLHVWCSELWFVEKVYDRVFTRGMGRGFAWLCARLDLGSARRLQDLETAGAHRVAADATSLDGLVDGVGRACGSLGRGGSWFHAGRIGAYLAVASAAGAVVLLWVLLR